MTPRTRRLLRWGATAVAFVLLALAARTVRWEESWRAMRGASPWLLVAAAAVNLASLATRAVRWWIFLRRAGAPSLGVALRAAVVGSGLNNVLPASGGEAARVLIVARRAGISTASVLAALALDRLVEIISSVAMMATAPFFVPLPYALSRWRIHAAVALAVLLALAAMLAVHAMRRAPLLGVGSAALAGGTGSGGRIRTYAAHFVAAVRGLPTPRRLALALALSLVAWIGQAAAYHLAALAVGLPATPLASAAAMLAVNLTFVFQLTPGNVGVFQLVYALVMSGFGISHHAAVGVALLIQAVQIFPVTALALLLAPRLFARRLRHPSDPDTTLAP